MPIRAFVASQANVAITCFFGGKIIKCTPMKLFRIGLKCAPLNIEFDSNVPPKILGFESNVPPLNNGFDSNVPPKILGFESNVPPLNNEFDSNVPP